MCTELYNNRALSHGLLRNSVTFYSQLDVASETSSLFLIAWLKMRNHYQDFLTRPTWIPWTSSPMPTESDKIQLNNEHSVVTVGFYTNEMFCCCLLITFSVSRRRRKMYCGHARLCVCLSVCLCVFVRGRTPTLLHGPGCNLEAWYRLPPSCALLGGIAIGARTGGVVMAK